MKKFSFIGLFLASFSFLSNENVEAADDEWVIIGKSNLRMDETGLPQYADCYVNIKKNGESITGFPDKRTISTGAYGDITSAQPCIIKGEVKDKQSGITLIYDVSAVGFINNQPRRGDCNQTVIVTNNKGEVLNRESTADGSQSFKKCGRRVKIKYMMEL